MNTLLLTCGTLESGGAERVISILSSPFADHFGKVWIATWREAPIFYSFDPRVTVISLPKVAQSDRIVKKGMAFRKMVKNLRPSIVLSFLSPFNMLTLVFLKDVHVIKVVAERNDPRFIKGGVIMRAIRNMLYKQADGILCQTQFIKKCFPKRLQSKICIIYNPVFLDQCLVGKALGAKKLNRIVAVGRLHPQKNHKMLIDAFAKFSEKYPDYTLIIYGKGELRDDILNYIGNIGMASRIFLPGEDKDVQWHITKAQMFVMTSFFEGMPNALIEAMCLGLPCVSTKVSGAIDLIKSGENGILVDTTVEAISKAMEDIASDSIAMKRLGKNAAILYNELKVENISAQWIACLDSFVKDLKE